MTTIPNLAPPSGPTQAAPTDGSMVKDGRILSGLEAFIQMLSVQLGDAAPAPIATQNPEDQKELIELMAKLREKISSSKDLSEEDKQQLLAMLAASPVMTDLIPLAVPASLTSDLSSKVALETSNTEDLGLMTEPELTELATKLNGIEPGSKSEVSKNPKESAVEKLLDFLRSANVSEEDIKAIITKIESTATFTKEQNITPDKQASITITNTVAPQPSSYTVQIIANQNEDISDQQIAATALTETDSVTDMPASLIAPAAKTDYLRSRYDVNARNDKAQTSAPAAETIAAKSDTPVARTEATAPKSNDALRSLIEKSDIVADSMSSTDLDGSTYIRAADSKSADVSSANTMTATKTLPQQTVQMIALQVQRNINAKVDSFNVQLTPVELGRLDIRMKFEKDGMKLHMTADNTETLNMLQKDTQQLERVLQQAGIQADSGSMTFDLRQQTNDGQKFGAAQENNAGTGSAESNIKPDVQIEIPVEAYGYIRSDRVNITV